MNSLRRRSRIYSLENRVRKLEAARGSQLNWETFDFGAHYLASSEYDDVIKMERGYTEEEMDNYVSWRRLWCLAVARAGMREHSFISMRDPFLFDIFESVWEDVISFFGRGPIKKDEFSGNEIYEYVINRAREYGKIWADRINDLKEPLLVDPSYVDRFEVIRLNYINYLENRSRRLK